MAILYEALTSHSRYFTTLPPSKSYIDMRFGDLFAVIGVDIFSIGIFAFDWPSSLVEPTPNHSYRRVTLLPLSSFSAKILIVHIQPSSSFVLLSSRIIKLS
jgi:hypothetical protein